MDLVLAARRAHHVRTLAERRDGGTAASARARAGRIGALIRASIRRSRRGFSRSPRRLDSPVGWIALPFFWWGGALWTGASLVALAPRRGMAACAMLAVAGEALLIGFAGPAVWRDPGNTDFVVFCTTGLIAAMPLLTGAAVARRRLVACAVLPQEQHR